MNEIVFTACSAFVVIEMISFLSGSERSVKVVCGLALTLILLTSLITAFDEISFAEFDVEEIESDPEPLYFAETQAILEGQVKDAMEAAGIYDTRTEVLLTMSEDYEVSIDSLKVGVRYSADLDRAKIILNQLFSGAYEGEVYLID